MCNIPIIPVYYTGASDSGTARHPRLLLLLLLLLLHFAIL
jgi:hypothetical protein